MNVVHEIQDFDHLTIDTGHSIVQTRDGVQAEVIEIMADCARGRETVFHGIRFRSRSIPGGWLFDIADATRLPVKPAVLCHVAAPGGSDAVWQRLRADRDHAGALGPIKGRQPTRDCWLAASFLPAMLLNFNLAGILGDAERCMTWSLLDRGTPGVLLKPA
jgi:hypothetical protein